MKKFAASILLLLYSLVSTGFVISVHYCMNKVASIEIGDSGNTACEKCGMQIKKKDGCCKDDVRIVKMHADQNFAKLAITDFSVFPFLPPHSDFYICGLYTTTQHDYPLAHGPPLSDQDIYLQNCVFRI